MNLVESLARHALAIHPGEASTVLERLSVAEAVELLSEGPLPVTASILERLSPHYAAAVLVGNPPDRAARLLEILPTESAARLLRRAGPNAQQDVLPLVERRRARAIRSVLAFPEGSAGSLMDPDVLGLPAELTAREALQRVKADPALARYNLYVVDQAQRLVGALNLRELFLAAGRAALADLMTRNPHSVSATADRVAVLTHPGWKEVHALPVVDRDGALLGAVRYRVLRQIEEELLSGKGGDADAGAAFGEAIAAGARGLLDAFTGTAEPRTGR
jgi:magnesium transporter